MDGFEKAGEHIPPFLIASITEQCNLHCKGCYARANAACGDSNGVKELTGEAWGDIFCQVEKLGVGFILLAGGEPLARREVLEVAGGYPNILFPIFTNGTLLDARYQKLLASCRNLVPILSMEGGQASTDNRRGEGVYVKVQQVMAELKNPGLLFGASVTVTTENVQEVTSTEFVQFLKREGCKAVIYVEYVPADGATAGLALGEAEREYIEHHLQMLREGEEGMLFISFPGDEKSSGGCLAAGRGFFHINAQGGAEPCPFSPYSDTNLQWVSLKDALKSSLFMHLRAGEILAKVHNGGCVLFDQREQVKQYLGEVKA